MFIEIYNNEKQLIGHVWGNGFTVNGRYENKTINIHRPESAAYISVSFETEDELTSNIATLKEALDNTAGKATLNNVAFIY